MTVMTRFVVAAALCLALPAQAQTWAQVFPLQDQKAFTVESGGTTVVVSPPPPLLDDREVSDEEYAATYSDPTIEIRFAGTAPFRVPADDALNSVYGISVGVGSLSAGGADPAVLIAGYSGGMHCCATLQVVTLVDGEPVSTTVPAKDGAPVDAFPQDIDGDGIRDLEWVDDSLLYAFTSYAGSWPVPRFYNVRGGELVDVTREPGFAPRLREFAAEALAACSATDDENAGPCAAYAYAMALQGQAEDGIRTAVERAGEPLWYPFDCTVELVDDACPAGKEREFAGFEEALRWMMRRHGYLPGG